MLFGTTVSRSIQRIGGFPKSNNRIENKKFELLLLGCGNCQLAKSYEWVRVPNENLKCIAGCTAGCTKPQTSEYTRKSSSGWKQAVFLFFLELDAGKETKHSHANSGLIAILRRFFSNLWGGASIGPSERYIKINKTCTTSTDKIVQLRLDFAERPNRPFFDNGSSFRSKDSSRKIRHGLRSLFRRNHNEIFAVVIP